jgi:hypothetical protein
MVCPELSTGEKISDPAESNVVPPICAEVIVMKVGGVWANARPLTKSSAIMIVFFISKASR